MLARKLMGASSSDEKLYVDDCFSCFLYTGNGSTKTITNGIDLAGEGGLVWTKVRSLTYNHELIDTLRGGNSQLYSNTTAAASTSTGLITFGSNGYSVGSASIINANTAPFASWTFRKAPKFFDVQTATLGTGNATVSFSGLSTLGMVIVKRTDNTGDWYVWHRSLTAGKLMYLNQTAAEATLGHITVSGTTLTLVDGTLADGNYVCYAFAHDTDTDGIIQCGSFTTDGSGNAAVNLGWEPQYMLVKAAVGDTGSWNILDTMRGLTALSGSNTARLYADSSSAESTAVKIYSVNASGFSLAGVSASVTFIYLAIRRPNKPPTSGTEVYNAIARTSTSNGGSVFLSSGIVSDFVAISSTNSWGGRRWCDRLRGGGKSLNTDDTSTEQAQSYATVAKFDSNSGVTVYEAPTGNTTINHFFRRAPGFFDVVCYTGTGALTPVNHSLGVVPELVIIKSRSNNMGTLDWLVYPTALATTIGSGTLHTTNWPGYGGIVETPTATTFTPSGTGNGWAVPNYTYVAYLFATLAGISKVGSYTGNGSTQTINCGFSAGARFILIKRTDSTGDWYVWDSVRGIVAANDPHLSLNTTAAEVTTDDSVDPDNSGFIANQNTTTNINVTSATYIFLAVA